VRQGFVRMHTGGRSPRAAAAASASGPTILRSSLTAHGESPVRTATSASSLPDGHSGGAAESLRSTAFTNPFSPWLARFTVSLTAACAGTRMKRS
jgi:hypothetical protein